jgi:hypothetical protein
MTAQQALENRDAQEVRLYVVGYLTGLVIANAELRLRNLPRLYCEPDRSDDGVSYDQALNIMSAYIKVGHGAAALNPFVGTMLAALHEAFPCR